MRTALTVSAALVAVGVSAPAASAAPKVPAGCTFDGTTGRTTCVTTTTIDITQTADQYDEGILYGDVPDGLPGGYLCAAYAPNSTSYEMDFNQPPPVLTGKGSTTTTTSYQGAAVGKGSKPLTTTTTSTVTYHLVSGTLRCAASSEPYVTYLVSSNPGANYTITRTS